MHLNTFLCILSVGVTDGRHGLFLVTLDLQQGLLPCSKTGSGGGISCKGLWARGLPASILDSHIGDMFSLCREHHTHILYVLCVCHFWMLFLCFNIGKCVLCGLVLVPSLTCFCRLGWARVTMMEDGEDCWSREGPTQSPPSH